MARVAPRQADGSLAAGRLRRNGAIRGEGRENSPGNRGESACLDGYDFVYVYLYIYICVYLCISIVVCSYEYWIGMYLFLYMYIYIYICIYIYIENGLFLLWICIRMICMHMIVYDCI